MRGLRLVMTAAVAVVALVAGANPASAAITTHTSNLGAGYKSAPAGSVSSATVTFKVPDITCASNGDFEALYLGVHALDGSGDETMRAFVQASCNLGSKLYFAEVTDGTSDNTLSIAIGDVIVAKLTETGTTSTAIIRNTTHSTKATISKSAAKDPSVLIGDSGWPTVPTFTSVHMSKAVVNGVVIGDAPGTNRERLKTGSTLQVGASLVTSGQSGFNLLFKSNS